MRRDDLLGTPKRPVRAVHEHHNKTKWRPDRPLPRVREVRCRLCLRRGRSLRALLRARARPGARAFAAPRDSLPRRDGRAPGAPAECQHVLRGPRDTVR